MPSSPEETLAARSRFVRASFAYISTYYLVLPPHQLATTTAAAAATAAAATAATTTAMIYPGPRSGREVHEVVEHLHLPGGKALRPRPELRTLGLACNTPRRRPWNKYLLSAAGMAVWQLVSGILL